MKSSIGTTLRRRVVVGLCLLWLSFGMAQSDSILITSSPEPEGDYYAGVGASFAIIVPILHAHIGFDDLFAEHVDLRIAFELFPRIYALSADAIFENPPNESKITRYSGFGARLLYFSDTSSGSEVLPGVGALGGMRYDLGTANLFGEVEINVVLAPTILRYYIELPIVPVPILRLGVEFPF